MRRKWWIVAVAAVLVAGLGYAGYSAWQDRRAVAQGSAEETAIVERGTLRETVDGTGSVAPQSEVSLAFSAAGDVIEVLVEEGDVVKSGDPLVRLDDTDARAAVSDAKIQVAQAENSLKEKRIKVEAGIAEASLEAAQAEYNQVAARSTDDQLASARTRLERALDALADAQEDYKQAWDPARDWELYVKRLEDALEAERESTEQALRKAQLDLEDAQANYNLAVVDVSGAEVERAQEQLLNAQVTAESESLELEGLKNTLEQAQLQLESAQRSLEETALTAPIDGTVTSLDVEVGERINAGQAVAALGNLTTLKVEINLDETDISGVSVGQEARIALDAFRDAELTGKVMSIAPVAQVESGVVLFPVTVQLSPTELPVRSGMTADVEIITASHEDALIVPLRAVHTEGDQAYVYRSVGDQTEQVEVSLGIVTDTEVEITGGLAEGEVVSVVGAPTQESNGEGFGPGGIFGGGRDD